MAQLLDWLAYAGARTSAGAPASSGAIWFYQAGGGTTLATVYSDVGGTVVSSNPVTLDAGGRAVVYVTSPVRAVIQDATGADVMDADQADVNRAETLQLANAGWSDTYLDASLTKIYQSTGGIDGQYQESTGATARTIRAKFAELSISVKDFGAKGDGLTVDTTAIQAAINRVKFLGGGIVYLPPGNYLIDQALSISGASGVNVIGAGIGVTVLKNTSGTGNVITCSSGSNSGSYRNFTITATVASTGVGLSLGNSQSVTVEAVQVLSHTTCISSTGSYVIFEAVSTQPQASSGATGRGLVLDSATQCTLIGCGLSGSGDASSYGLSLKNSTADLVSLNAIIDRLNFDSTLTGSRFNFIGIGGVVIVYGGATMPSALRIAGQWGSSGMDGQKQGILSAATGVPDLTQGTNITFDATTTGSAYTINVPSPPPAANDYGFYMTLTFWAHAGGAITGWGLAAGYHVSSGPSTVDTHKTTYRFHWDPDNSVWREVSRSDTT